MIEQLHQQVNTSSTEFKEGVEAGLKSTEPTKNWVAGHDLGEALKDESEHQTPASMINSYDPPLFKRSSPERPRRNDQDEKDESEE